METSKEIICKIIYFIFSKKKISEPTQDSWKPKWNLYET